MMNHAFPGPNSGAGLEDRLHQANPDRASIVAQPVPVNSLSNASATGQVQECSREKRPDWQHYFLLVSGRLISPQVLYVRNITYAVEDKVWKISKEKLKTRKMLIVAPSFDTNYLITGLFDPQIFLALKWLCLRGSHRESTYCSVVKNIFCQTG